MINLPAAGSFSASPRPTWSEAKALQDDIVEWCRQSIEGATLTAVVIASGTFTLAEGECRACTVDTEGAAATDDLANIATTNIPIGGLVLLTAEDVARVVTVKNSAGGAGQIALAYGADVALDSARKWLLLRRDGPDFLEVARFGFHDPDEITIKTAAYTITRHDHGETFTNEGATVEVVLTLPTAVAGLRYRFVVQDADGIEVNAGAADTIRDGASVSAAAGKIESTEIGAVIELLAINATEWIVLAKQRTWTVT